MSYKNAYRVLIYFKGNETTEFYEIKNVSAASVAYLEERFSNGQNFSVSSLDSQNDKTLFNIENVSHIELIKTS